MLAVTFGNVSHAKTIKLKYGVKKQEKNTHIQNTEKSITLNMQRNLKIEHPTVRIALRFQRCRSALTSALICSS